jgi:hypothetical protein
VGVDRSFKQLWKAQIPLKIKIYLWLMWHNALARNDNMKKEIGLVVSLVNSALVMKTSIIYSLLVLWMLTCRVPLAQSSECILGLLVTLSISGGLPKFFHLVLIYTL